MKALRNGLLIIVTFEVLIGLYLASSRLARFVPPQTDFSFVDTATADQIRTAAAQCETAADWRALGELYMAAGYFAESEMCHRVACEMSPDKAVLQRQWAFALERLGLLTDANAQYQRAMELSPAKADACRYFIARNELRAEQSEAARRHFTEGSRLSANQYELARLQLRANQTSDAMKSFVPLYAADPQALQLNLFGYRLALLRGDRPNQLRFADWTRYAPRKLQNPFDEEVERLINVTAQLGPGRLWKQASELIDNDRLDEAQSLLENLPGSERGSGVLELLAEVALRQQKFERAHQLFEKLQQDHGPFARITARIGDVYAAAGQPARAHECWLKAAQLQTGVDLKATYHKLADSLTQQGDEAGATPYRALGHYWVGRELLQLGHAPQSINYFLKATELTPDSIPFWFYLGEAQRISDEVEAATEAYQECLKRNPLHGRARAAMELLEANKTRDSELQWYPVPSRR